MQETRIKLKSSKCCSSSCNCEDTKDKAIIEEVSKCCGSSCNCEDTEEKGIIEQRQQSPNSSGGGFAIEKAVSGETQSSIDVVQTPRASEARRYSLRELVPDSFRYKRLTKFEETSSCCGQQPEGPSECDAPWITGRLKTSAGRIPQVSTTLSKSDILGSWKVRWGIGRMNYKVDPGLYCVGVPDSKSPVLVSANYKMSFDRLRSELKDINAFILVLDTKGINVWCAAGKGTYGTDELVNRIEKVKLAQVVSHRTVIAAQLGAPGIAAHEVQKQTGFRVIYGPVRAEDLPQYLQSGMKATAEMRKVKFTFMDRLVLTPIELVGAIKPSLIILGVLFLLNLTGIKPFGLTDFYGYLGAVIIGGVITPILLPWIPFRAFALKGWVLGILWALSVSLLNGWPETPQYGWVRALAYLLLLPAVSAYGAMNFTGCSTYTSPSGVNREMKTAIPTMVVSLALGIVLILIDSIFII